MGESKQCVAFKSEYIQVNTCNTDPKATQHTLYTTGHANWTLLFQKWLRVSRWTYPDSLILINSDW